MVAKTAEDAAKEAVADTADPKDSANKPRDRATRERPPNKAGKIQTPKNKTELEPQDRLTPAGNGSGRGRACNTPHRKR